MKTRAKLTLLAAFALSAACHAAPKAEDALARASKSGVDMTEPVTITFEWTRSQEGSNAKKAAQVLQEARFVVTTSSTEYPEPARSEYRLSAKWTGVLQEAQMQRVITRMAELTTGQGSLNWQVTQVRR